MSLCSRSLSGQPFAVEHHILLRTVAAARCWKGNVWVPVKVSARLNLPLRPETVPPVRLGGSNGSSFVYHAQQFSVPLSALQEAWDSFIKRETLLATAHNGDSELNSEPAPAEFPLSTNGERFDRVTEELMLQCCGRLRSASPYWATAAEASYIYRAPFREEYLTDAANAVYTCAFPLCRPVAFYNVEGTVDPGRFTATTCCRYDPVNYEGKLYKPGVAVVMKAWALRHHCLHERQWITTYRAQLLGLSAPPLLTPVSFCFTKPVDLVNIAVLRRSEIIRGRVISSSGSPADPGAEATSESALEGTLLMSSNCTVVDTLGAQVLGTPSLPS
ncbi:hypothetical protein ABL78_1571 [Leptomonas seymouri]|uniref:Trypanosoma Tc-38 (p38) protein domain-containing protein n=1 Tax=Leptomonas seymouri TaxID=5684 RepID=A0A0N1IMA4_LEPSE|nr:hypothetical protein ABL78_1571 [Leptomonas seymouri]|eukprot:KPI89342.1 hypothetical protein ABL78_1571 [Leptomonas seymouri]